MSLLKQSYQAIYLYTNGYLDTLSDERKSGIIGSSLISNLIIIFKNIIKEFLYLFRKNPSIKIHDATICVIQSKNNFEVLKFLSGPNIKFLKFSHKNDIHPDLQTIILKEKFLYSLRFLFCLPLIMLNKSNRKYIRLIHASYGMQNIYQKFFMKHKPQKLVFANDHTPMMRACILAVKHLEIPTYYIQHGSVSKYFPPLIFDHALLESSYSEEIYNNIGIAKSTIIYKIGIPKLSQVTPRIRSSIKRIGLAVNQNDDLTIIREVIAALRADYTIILRKHPADLRKFDYSLVEDGNRYDVISFINDIDFMIASDSSIHVEANSLLCRSVYYQMHNNDNKKDYYGFVQNGFIDEVNHLIELNKYLSNFDYNSFDFHSDKMVFYNESLKRSFRKNSLIFAKQIIKSQKNRYVSA